ncbi:MAG: hypothetical protein M1824_001969 [Vezdaea acicularis]|nr:MAG: hypothetical protein M1824_001969 [Vezdaea acicularis]
MDSVPEYPYRIDQTLRLQLESSSLWYANVTIKRVWPITVAVVLLVTINDVSNAFTNFPEQAILKIYDRRYSHNYRDYQKAGNYTLVLERHYQSLVAKGWDAAFSTSNLDEGEDEGEDEDEDQDEADDEEEVDPLSEGAQAWADEAILQHAVLNDWSKEHTAYDRLRSIQGKEIPIMYAAMMIDAPGKPSDIVSLPCGALLLEYIDGQSLEDVARHLPPTEFHKIYQATLSILHKIARLGVINRDSVARDWLLREHADSKLQPVQIDFGHARIQENENMQEWLNMACGSNQEGRILFTIKKLPACRYLFPSHDFYRFYQVSLPQRRIK